ncbi:hypothetical protein GCM10023084_58200 [Streptomyces lacrimifluminis]|uniref:HTH hxlR-type domain-containing protein n=1 Tax=Streptomyces lacrimifluminis TaxID=1500077 RepID=A0A917LDR2_9ACTN|nr:hypothetical protein GCM10012282_61400 [Streptomyces lacrimifluminis]
MAALREGPRRRRELRTAIGGISDKVLTESPRRLLAAGLVDRHAHAEAPPRVEYGLTSWGRCPAAGRSSTPTSFSKPRRAVRHTAS